MNCIFKSILRYIIYIATKFWVWSVHHYMRQKNILKNYWSSLYCFVRLGIHFIIQNFKWRLFQNGGTHDQPGRRMNDKWLITLALLAEYSFGPRLIKSVYPPGKPEGWRTHFLLLKYLLYRISHSPDHISCTGYHTVQIISL